MAAGNFEACLAETLKWEGGYSNHPDDPGGLTMRGIIQREYDVWRKKQGKRTRPVRQIEEIELRAIYRAGYWDAMGCDGLAAGLDMAVFDAAVNSGVTRARGWLNAAPGIDAFCDERLAFLRGLGRLWRVFGAGWSRRVAGVRNAAHLMNGAPVMITPEDRTLHAGMRGPAVLALQAKLRALGYPCGEADGVFGEQTYRAVMIFQYDHELQGEPGIWLPTYNETLATAKPMLPGRADITHKDLAARGDRPVKRLNLLQRALGWIFGGAAVGEALGGSSLSDSLTGFRLVAEPIMSTVQWLGGHWLLLVAAGAVAGIALVRAMRADHVEAYRNFDYQGQVPAVKEAA